MQNFQISINSIVTRAITFLFMQVIGKKYRCLENLSVVMENVTEQTREKVPIVHLR